MTGSKANGGSTVQSILWRRLDLAGHESARVRFDGSRWNLEGSAVFARGDEPCRLDYAILCDPGWRTQSARISGWVHGDTVAIELAVYPDQRWRFNGEDCPAVTGCLDLDLNFSPSTNLLPIRRLDLQVGQEAKVRAAWLRFPGFALEPLEQVYRRTGVSTYRYESAGGRFVSDLEVNDAGFVTLYPGYWEAQTNL